MLITVKTAGTHFRGSLTLARRHFRDWRLLVKSGDYRSARDSLLSAETALKRALAAVRYLKSVDWSDIR